MSVKVEHYETRLKRRLQARIRLTNRRLLEDIHVASLPMTPFLTGDLRGQVYKTTTEYTGTITWTVPYAAYQERGMRKDGSHVVKHYSKPNTNKHFAKRAVQKVVTNRNIKKYMDAI